MKRMGRPWCAIVLAPAATPQQQADALAKLELLMKQHETLAKQYDAIQPTEEP